MRIVAIAMACVLVCAMPLRAAAPPAKCGDVTFEVLSKTVDTFRHGCYEHRVLVRSLSTGATLAVTVEIGGGGELSLVRSVSLEPLGEATLSFFQPPLQLNGRRIDVRVGGTRHSIDERVSVNCSRYRSGDNTTVLLGRSINADDFKNTMLPRGMPVEVEAIKAETDIDDWSANWLSYSRYDGVALGSDEYAKASAAVRGALDEYVRAGGVVAVLGDTMPAIANELPEHGRSTALARVKCAGFGAYMACMSKNARDLAGEQAQRLMELCLATDKPMYPDLSTLMSRLPVVSDVSVPVRGMLLILIVFSLLIGPVNVMLLAKVKKRMWFWSTVPAIAGVTTVLILGYALVSEGITPSARYMAATILNQRTSHAATIGFAGFYFPIAPSDGLRFNATTEVSPVLSSEQSGWRLVDQTQQQHFRNGWIRSRVPCYFMCRSSEVRRERLDVTRDASSTQEVVNSLGATIKELWIADASGRVSRASAIAPGARCVLTPLTSVVALGGWRTLRSYYEDESWWTDVTGFTRSAPTQILRPGMYVAVLDGAPFADKGYARRAKTQAVSVVVGIMDKEQ